MYIDQWLERPLYVGVVAFLAGAALTAVVFLILGVGGGDDGDGIQDATPVVATATITAVPLSTSVGGATGTPASAAQPTATPEATSEATPAGPLDADEALADFVLEEFGETFIGACPQEVPQEGVPEGICGTELYRSDELVTFTLGAPFSEGIGEAVITRNEDGSWTVSFVPAPSLGGPELSIGAEAVVFAVGNCLNFREEPGTGAEVLSCEIDGTRGIVVEGPVDADGIVWWRLDGLGWASDEFIVPTTG